MYFTHESRYLQTHLSREAVIVQPGHFNWSTVLARIYKPMNGFTISTDLRPTSLQQGEGRRGERGSMPAFNLLLLDDFPSTSLC